MPSYNHTGSVSEVEMSEHSYANMSEILKARENRKWSRPFHSVQPHPESNHPHANDAYDESPKIDSPREDASPQPETPSVAPTATSEEEQPTKSSIVSSNVSSTNTLPPRMAQSSVVKLPYPPEGYLKPRLSGNSDSSSGAPGEDTETPPRPPRDSNTISSRSTIIAGGGNEGHRSSTLPKLLVKLRPVKRDSPSTRAEAKPSSSVKPAPWVTLKHVESISSRKQVLFTRNKTAPEDESHVERLIVERSQQARSFWKTMDEGYSTLKNNVQEPDSTSGSRRS